MKTSSHRAHRLLKAGTATHAVALFVPARKLTALLVATTLSVGQVPLVWSQSVNSDSGAPSSASPVNYEGKAGSADYQARLETIEVVVARNHLPADGNTPAQITLRLLNPSGKLATGKTMVTIEASAGRIKLEGTPTDELGPRALDRDRITSGVQVEVTDGEARFSLLAPLTPQDVRVRVTSGGISTEGDISFVPELRDWIATGLIEGVIKLRSGSNESTLTPVRINDGFEQALRQWSRTFNAGSGKTWQAAARTAFFVRGTIRGEYLLSALYDSDKETRASMLRDIRPDEIYPVFGDASLKGFENRSAAKLFVRVDKGRHYALFGDFNTGSGFTNGMGQGQVAGSQQRSLGSYNRSLTGARFHFEQDYLVNRATVSPFAAGPEAATPAAKGAVVPGTGYVANAFAARDTLRQIVEDLPGNGTSGPYGLSRANAIDGTEKVELITRDRNNPGRIIDQKPLQRLVDYSFDPFSGRLLMKGPVASTDPLGNPQSIRITYEVDAGGPTFWVAGADAQLRLGPRAEVGGAVYINQDPSAVLGTDERKTTRITSVNGSYLLGDRTRVIAELAHTSTERSFGGVHGSAARIDLSTGSADQRWSAGARYARADRNFYNPNAPLNEGRSEFNARGQYRVSDKTTLRAEVVQSKDDVVGAKREGASLGADYQWSQNVSASMVVRRSRDNGSGLYSPVASAGAASLYSSATTGLTPSGGGLFGMGTGPATDPALGQVAGMATQVGSGIDTTTVGLGVKARITPTVTLGLNGESNISADRAWRAAATANWQVSERTRLHARYEAQTGLGSFHDRADRNTAFVAGVSNTYLKQGLGEGQNGLQGEVFSEYRLRDAIGGRESQLASGLRNTFELGKGWRAVAGVERVMILNGTGQQATSVATGLEYVGSELWKGSTRLEFRRLDANSVAPAANSILSTISLARKLSRDWSMLARNYYARTDNTAIDGTQSQMRTQLGVAYRPVDSNRFDALAMVERKSEKNGELAPAESRTVNVLSLQGNWHPSRPWWVSGRLAYKHLTETLNVAATGVTDSFNGTLLGTRLIYDFTERWDAGLMASVLSGQGSQQKALGFELGYALKQNLWLGVGYNWSGFTDRDLTGSEYTSKGPFIRLRFKFDEDLFRGASKDTNRALPR